MSEQAITGGDILGEEQNMSIFDQGYALVVGVGADLPNTVDDAVGLVDILKDPARLSIRPCASAHRGSGPP